MRKALHSVQLHEEKRDPTWHPDDTACKFISKVMRDPRPFEELVKLVKLCEVSPVNHYFANTLHEWRFTWAKQTFLLARTDRTDTIWKLSHKEA